MMFHFTLSRVKGPSFINSPSFGWGLHGTPPRTPDHWMKTTAVMGLIIYMNIYMHTHLPRGAQSVERERERERERGREKTVVQCRCQGGHTFLAVDHYILHRYEFR